MSTEDELRAEVRDLQAKVAAVEALIPTEEMLREGASPAVWSSAIRAALESVGRTEPEGEAP